MFRACDRRIKESWGPTKRAPISCVSHVTFNQKIIFCYLDSVSPKPNTCFEQNAKSPLAYMGLHPDGDPSGLRPRWMLVHIGCLEPTYNGIYPDGCLSRTTAYTGLYPDGDPLWGLPERWRFTHVGCSEPAYNGIYPDGRPSR